MSVREQEKRPAADGQKRALIKQVHVLKAQAGLTQWEYDALLGGYGVESSVEMTVAELRELCRRLREIGEQRRERGEMDMFLLRRRLIAAVSKFCQQTVRGWERMAPEVRLEYAKSVACRAAGMERRTRRGRDNFNVIGADRVRSLTYAFNNRSRDLEAVTAAAEAALTQGGAR